MIELTREDILRMNEEKKQQSEIVHQYLIDIVKEKQMTSDSDNQNNN